jgi:hypothetical protein
VAITNIVVQTPALETLYTDSAMGNTADAIKGSSALVYYLFIDNSANAGAPTYVKLFNLAAGSVIVGTTVPDEVIYVPAAAKITHILWTGSLPGKTFNVALSAIAVTTGGTAGSTAPTSAVPVTVSYV